MAVAGVVQFLRGQLARAELETVTDAQMLQRFIAGRDEGAFAALVRRYAAMVWGVCSRDRALRRSPSRERRRDQRVPRQSSARSNDHYCQLIRAGTNDAVRVQCEASQARDLRANLGWSSRKRMRDRPEHELTLEPAVRDQRLPVGK